MKKADRNVAGDMRPEYDFASMSGGVRGKYVKSCRAGTNLVLLDPEVSKAFPTDAAVNQTLRAVLEMTKTVRQLNKARRPASLAQRRKTGSSSTATRLAVERLSR